MENNLSTLNEREHRNSRRHHWCLSLSCRANRDGCPNNPFPRSTTSENDFLRHPLSINDFPATSHCFAIIIYLISPINCELMVIYQAEQSGPDQMLLPTLTSGIFLGNIFKYQNDHRDKYGGAILAQQGGFLTVPCLS